MRIAILDTVPKEYWHHDLGITDGQKFVDFLAPEMPETTFDVFYTAENSFPPQPNSFDGFLITGSPCSVNDNTSWMQQLASQVKKIVAEDKPLAGFCFGHQFIAKTLGGQVGKNEGGWNIGLFDLEIDREQAWMQPAQAVTPLYHFNKERVTALPENAVAFAHSAQYADFGYTIGSKILSIQGHPEHPKRAMLNFITASEGILEANIAATARESFDSGEPHAALWARWVAQFFYSSTPDNS